MGENLLEIENLEVDFPTENGVLNALRGISFSLQRGETLGVVGESGCGKSLSNLAIMNLLPPQAVVRAQKIEFMGRDLRKLSTAEWQKVRGEKIAMIFQDPMSALNPSFSVGFQVEEVLYTHTNVTKKEARDKAINLLGLVGIPSPESRLRAYPHELSGGMAQRVMIAMAVACDPELLIADEPTTALDVTIQAQILALLKELQEKKHMGMILVTHDIAVVSEIASKVQVMYAGEVVESGATKDVMEDPIHPYTAGLLASLPAGKREEFRCNLKTIRGLVPHLSSRPKGCQFAPRCDYRRSTCELSVPPLEQIKGREVRCYFPLVGGTE